MGLMARLRWLLLGVLGVVSVGLAPGVASAAGCPNEALRTGYSASLPDCRAYEMVSPVDKNEGAVGGPGGVDWFFHPSWRSSLDGSRMAFSSSQAFADSQTGAAEADFYVASRGAGGWSTHALLPPQHVNPGSNSPIVGAFSPDLSSYLLGIGGPAGEDLPPLVGGEPRGTTNLFVRSTDSGASQLVDVTPPGVTPPSAAIGGAITSPDLSHVVFEDVAKLTPDAPAEGSGMYEWSGGAVTLVGINTAEEPAKGAGGPLLVSEDGSRVLFRSDNCGLCLREVGARRTVRVDASQGWGPGGGGQFQTANGDLSRIFFLASASSGLTNDTPTGDSPSSQNLYEYDAVSGKLTDLTPVSEVEVQGVSGLGNGGEYVYFVANGALAAGATAGERNLYVLHEGAVVFIATLNPEAFEGGDRNDWEPGNLGHITTRVSADGTMLAFPSFESLTGYDNVDAVTGKPDREVYVYDAVTGRLVCASCNPSGARPVGSAFLDEFSDGELPWVPRAFSSDGGRVFFDSEDALVPGDTNGQRDVYEYANGGVHLISSGTSGEASTFVEASPSGDDVFFTTSQPLVGQDVDRQFDLYDARVGGGFPGPLAAVSCGGEDCRGAPSGAPVLGVPGSASLAGVGNLAPAVAAPVVVSKPKPKHKPKKRVRRRRRRAKRSAARGARRGGWGHSTGKRG
jgi:hypothetical protein